MGKQVYKFAPDLKIKLKGKQRLQVAAICYRKIKSGREILLITSRDTGRWIIPKGWPIDGLTPREAAGQEAWEEAGVKGKLRKDCLGVYKYRKRLETGSNLPVTVAVFAIEVKKLSDKFPERGQRRRKWFSPKKAASRVQEPELKRLLKEFRPKHAK